MDITRFAIENNRITFVALIVVLMAGADSYFELPRAEDPGFTIRTAVVRTIFPGANPERVENLVTDEIEKAVQEMPELDFVTSQSRTGASFVFVNILEEYRDMRPIWDKLRRKVEDNVPALPDGIRGPFIDDEFGDTFGTLIGLTGDGYDYAELYDVALSVRDMLLRLQDAGKVEIHGRQEERVFVEYNNARLAELGLSVVQLQQILQARNILISGGSISTGVERIILEPSGNFDSVEDLRRTVISVPGRSDVLYLEDIAEIQRGYIDPPESMARVNGQPGLVLAVSIKEGGNITRLGEEVQTFVERLNHSYPLGIEFQIVAFQPAVVERKVSDFVNNVLQAIAIVLAVMLLMLGIRTGLVVATLVPSAMLMALMIMGMTGIGLNQISLAALIIALGMLVDNAIVMSESIMVQMAAGKPGVEAAVNSAKELRVPLLTSSLTTAAAFLPIYLAESTVGEYTNQLFTVVSITLLSSWLLAITVIPLMCVMFLKVKRDPDAGNFNTLFYRTYRRGLLGAVRHPILSLLGVLAIFFVAMQGLGLIPNIFFPKADKPIFTAEYNLPVGTDIERTQQVVLEIEEFLKSELLATEQRAEGVTTWSTYIGKGAPRFTLAYGPEQPSPEHAFMVLNATSVDNASANADALEEFCRERFPDIEVLSRLLQTGPLIEHPVEVRVSGEDVTTLFGIVDEVKSHVRSLRGTKNIGDDWGQRTKKIVVEINNPRARRSGVTNQDIAISLQSVLSGYTATDYREGDEVIPVTMRSVAADRKDIGKLESLNVYSQGTGRSVPLKQVADLHVEWQPARILRRNRLKSVKVHADLGPGLTASEITDQLIPWLEEQQKAWPLGYRWELGGEFEESGKGNQSIAEKLPIGALIIVLLLVGQFNSLRRPLIILLTIPLGMIGVVAGLLIANSYFGFITLLGIISLAGIVINNAIVLLDRINIEISDNGLPPPRAIIEAAQRRLRPILLTTATTVGGLIPLWMGGGPMFEPMAITILFGLIFATALTLGVVPILYTLFFRVRFQGFVY